MNKKIAFLFIGQTPRPDVMDDVRERLGDGVDVQEKGALDSLSDPEISAIAPLSPEDTLITKLRDGQEVRVSETALKALLEQRAAEAADEGAELCAIMCTGSFDLKCPVPVLTADEAFHGQSFPEGTKTIGLMVPLADQQETFAGSYRIRGFKVLTGVADPYGSDDALAAEAARLAEAGADLICLDCMGYTAKQAGVAANACSLPVRIPRIEIANNIIKERS